MCYDAAFARIRHSRPGASARTVTLVTGCVTVWLWGGVYRESGEFKKRRSDHLLTYVCRFVISTLSMVPSIPHPITLFFHNTEDERSDRPPEREKRSSPALQVRAQRREPRYAQHSPARQLDILKEFAGRATRHGGRDHGVLGPFARRTWPLVAGHVGVAIAPAAWVVEPKRFWGG